MADLLSPGFQIKESEIQSVVPSVSSTVACYVGQFNWGPLNTLMLVDNEITLNNVYDFPTNSNYLDYFSAANVLKYGDTEWVVRVGNESGANTALRIKNATASNSSGYLIKNNDDYEHNYSTGQLKTVAGDWVAKYPGLKGTGLRVSVCSSANTYQSTLTGEVFVTANTTIVTGNNTSFTAEVSVGDLLTFGGEVKSVESVANNTSLTLSTKHISGASHASVLRNWEFYANFNVAPGTSQSVSDMNGEFDEMHIVVVDGLGKWTGQTNAVLETFPFVSKASDAKLENGETNYYKNVINSTSKYIRWGGSPTTLTNIGSTGVDKTFVKQHKPLNYTLVGGNDGSAVTDADRIRGWTLFQNKNTIIDIVIGGAASKTLATWLTTNLAERRKDCVLFISPVRSSVVNNTGSEITSILSDKAQIGESSYVNMDDNWKYQFDRFNDVNRWLPCNPDTAGIWIASDKASDPWKPAAGLQRGKLKDVIKLAWDPQETGRNILYPNGINSYNVTSSGIFLWGQKTMLSRPSIFGRTSTRRLFLYCERAIGLASQGFLFEYNDEITQAQFVNTIEPFLSNIKGRGGIIEFDIVCDNRNNTPDTIAKEQLNAKFYIAPNHAAEFITLEFIGVPTSQEFTTVVGRS